MQDVTWMDDFAKNLDMSSWMIDKGMGKPFRIGKFVCVTDGRFAIGVVSDKELAEPKDEKSIKVLRDYFAVDLCGPDYDADHLKAWCDRPAPPCPKCKNTRRMTCTECNGSGETECCCDCGDLTHEITCDSCEGEKVTDCECVVGSIPAEVFGPVVNILLLRTALRHLSGRFKVAASDETKPLILGNDEWIAAVMPMIKTQAKEKYEPRLAMT